MPLRPMPTAEAETTSRVVTAKGPNHVWIAVAVDHFSRHVIGFAVSTSNPRPWQ